MIWKSKWWWLLYSAVHTVASGCCTSNASFIQVWVSLDKISSRIFVTLRYRDEDTIVEKPGAVIIVNYASVNIIMHPKQSTVRQSIRQQPVCMCISVRYHGAVWIQATVSQSIREQPVCAYQPVLAMHSGNKPLSVSPSESSLYAHINLLLQCSLETSHCQSVHQRAACMRISTCCHDAVWKQATVSQSAREQPVCTCQCVVMVQSGNKPLSVTQSESSLYVHISLLSWCSLKVNHCQIVTRSTTCQSAIILRSCGNVLLTRNWPPKTYVLASITASGWSSCGKAASVRRKPFSDGYSVSQHFHMIPRSYYYCAQQPRVWWSNAVSQSLPSDRSLEASHCQSVRQRAACMCISVCCHGAVWKQTTVSQFIKQQPVHVNLLSWCSLEASHCQSVTQSQSNLCVHVSLLPWCSLETSHCQRTAATSGTGLHDYYTNEVMIIVQTNCI